MQVFHYFLELQNLHKEILSGWPGFIRLQAIGGIG